MEHNVSQQRADQQSRGRPPWEARKPAMDAERSAFRHHPETQHEPKIIGVESTTVAECEAVSVPIKLANNTVRQISLLRLNGVVYASIYAPPGDCQPLKDATAFLRPGVFSFNTYKPERRDPLVVQVGPWTGPQQPPVQAH